jgi:Fe-S oxidoreductase
MLYKPHLAEKMHRVLNRHLGVMDVVSACCRNQPALPPGTRVINICPGCDRRFRENYTESTTVSVWEILAGSDFFPFPDYEGMPMSIMDACPTRDQPRVHAAVRILLERMNISLIEPMNTGAQSVCCGDRFYGEIPVDRVKKFMAQRASEMPAENVVVYCVSCVKSVHNGGRTPRYLVDLLFGEATHPGTFDPDLWHAELEEYIRSH